MITPPTSPRTSLPRHEHGGDRRQAKGGDRPVAGVGRGNPEARGESVDPAVLDRAADDEEADRADRRGDREADDQSSDGEWEREFHRVLRFDQAHATRRRGSRITTPSARSPRAGGWRVGRPIRARVSPSRPSRGAAAAGLARRRPVSTSARMLPWNRHSWQRPYARNLTRGRVLPSNGARHVADRADEDRNSTFSDRRRSQVRRPAGHVPPRRLRLTRLRPRR